ncbi:MULTISPECIES: DUF742 domain-containing protein [unclassified Streptomyces]|uniref:DUF742 domain-containing protein n=1 Tax=unclassified Streptomyces TaxID=2593676 RepID=UPI002DDB0916|nr:MULTISPECIES: DUF742 domain-containing protein [unclassified Streptomyces]WSA90452.1 DUF742 domain-containing protein [Streptomyces sp. NBC_01795]WSS16939.1 DUF742 domain-containing protein [Streptomyces sp. NBC_01186]WSS45683.1 DUF742 domain-containing protein [Streptomyces sp. NBC_01187]
MRGRGEDRWYDAEAGPVARPYTADEEGGEPVELDLLAGIEAVSKGVADRMLGPQHETLLDICAQGPLSLAELAAATALPLGVVRVLLGDLHRRGHVSVRPPGSFVPSRPADAAVLSEVIDGIRAL